MTALLLALASPAAARHDHHATDHAAAPAPLYAPEDLAFLAHMIAHHQQAIDMGALVPDRSGRPELRRFARYIASAQAAEIRMMSGMLDMAAERGLPAPMDHAAHHADPPMAGMLSAAEMAALATAEGALFERLWLEGMTFHHEGGLAMARAQQLEQVRTGRRPHGLDVMVEDLIEVQRSEVAEMSRWLEGWGLATDAPDARAPASEVASPVPGATLTAGAQETSYGVAVDNRSVAAVEVAIEDLSTNRWLRRDGGWGAREALPAELWVSGPAGAAWTISWTPPAAGRYRLSVEAVDDAGNRAPGLGTREVEAQ